MPAPPITRMTDNYNLSVPGWSFCGGEVAVNPRKRAVPYLVRRRIRLVAVNHDAPRLSIGCRSGSSKGLADESLFNSSGST